MAAGLHQRTVPGSFFSEIQGQLMTSHRPTSMGLVVMKQTPEGLSLMIMPESGSLSGAEEVLFFGSLQQ
jgi:hypothetical protein